MELFVPLNIQTILMQAIPAQYRWKCLLFEKWKQIIGPLHGKVHIQNIDKHIMLLRVSHPCWAQELLMMSAMLKKKINRVIGENSIKEIRFSYQSFIKNEIQNPKNNRPSKEMDAHISLLATQMTDAETKALNIVEEPDLQKILKSFYVSCKKKQLFANKNR